MPNARRSFVTPSRGSSRDDVPEIDRKHEANVAMKRLKALVEKTSQHLHGEAYVFNRADAYEPETPCA